MFHLIVLALIGEMDTEDLGLLHKAVVAIFQFNLIDSSRPRSFYYY